MKKTDEYDATTEKAKKALAFLQSEEYAKLTAAFSGSELKTIFTYNEDTDKYEMRWEEIEYVAIDYELCVDDDNSSLPLHTEMIVWHSEEFDSLSEMFGTVMDRLRLGEENGMETFDDALREFVERLNPWRGRPASSEDIEKCQERMKDKRLPALPQGYLDFLSKHNGLEFDGIEFFGTGSIKSRNRESDYVLKDIVTVNKRFIKDNADYLESMSKYLVLGSSCISLYAYNTKTLQYVILSRYEDRVRERFDSFDLMFTDIFAEWIYEVKPNNEKAGG